MFLDGRENVRDGGRVAGQDGRAGGWAGGGAETKGGLREHEL